MAPAEAAIGPVLVAALGGALLALGEGRPWPAALTPPLVLFAHAAVDRRRLFHLPAVAANLLGVAAAAVALTELGTGEIEARLLFGAHLLVYLSWIVSFQKKTFKVCWSLVALAVLQVAVASVLTAGAVFGLGLLVFLGLTLWSLANLSSRWPDADRLTPEPHRPVRRDPTASVVSTGRAGADRAAGSQRAVLAVLLAAAAVGITLFLLTPRVWLSRRPPIDPGGGRGVGAAFTGFTGEVRLGALGEILESRAPAFEVEAERPRRALSLAKDGAAAVFGTEEPLFRGRALDHYQAGRWSDRLDGAADRRSISNDPPPPGTAAAVERYVLRNLGDDVMIHAGGVSAVVFAKPGLRRATLRPGDGLLVRPSGTAAAGDLEYTVYTRPRDDGGPSGGGAGPPGPLSLPLRTKYLQLPPHLPAVAAAAEEAVRRPGVPVPADAALPPDRLLAERLTAYLRDSGRFGYSLDLSVEDPTVDAVEDFLANKRRGHCEYFATALALMLRDRGIPSRVVTGFKGGDLNRATRRFEVQQRHAHAWAEAYVGGRWETFDPTPAAARTASVADKGPRFTTLSELVSGAELLWAEYVVRMSLAPAAGDLRPAVPRPVAAADRGGRPGRGRSVRRWVAAGLEIRGGGRNGAAPPRGGPVGGPRPAGPRVAAGSRAAGTANGGTVLAAIRQAGGPPGRRPRRRGDPRGVRRPRGRGLGGPTAPRRRPRRLTRRRGRGVLWRPVRGGAVVARAGRGPVSRPRPIGRPAERPPAGGRIVT